MATRLDYRLSLRDKLLGLEDSGYGDVEFTDSECNTYLELAVSRLFPALYKRQVTTALSLVAYGHRGFSYATVTVPEDRIFMIEDTEELEPVRGWMARSGRVLNLPDDLVSVYVHYYDAYTLPSDDVTATNIPAVYEPLVVLGALVEALESKHDTGARPDPTTGYVQSSLLDRLQRRWDELKQELGMSLPAVVV